MAKDKRLQHLRLKHRQWVFCRRLPKDVAEVVGKQFFVMNLGVSDVLQAMRLRTRQTVTFEDYCDKVRRKSGDEDAALAAEYAALPQYSDERDAFEDGLLIKATAMGARETRKGVLFYNKVAGQEVEVSFYLSRYLNECKAVETTQAARRSTIKRFEAWLEKHHGEPFIHLVSKKVAGEFASQLASEGLLETTVNYLISILSGYWRWMLKRGLALDNPIAGQQSRIRGAAKQRLAWTTDDIMRLLHSAPNALLKHTIAVAALSGLRASEITALTVGACKGGVFDVKQSKSPSGVRKVPIHSQLDHIIAARTEGKPDDALLFPEVHGDGKNLSKRFSMYRARLFGKTNGSSQAERTLHSCRHYFVQQRLLANCDLYILQSVVGHAPQGVTLGVYHSGPSLEQRKACVEAASLPLE